VISALSILEGFISASPGTTQLDPSMRCGYAVAGAIGRINRVMSNSFGFGGSNCSLVLSRA